MTGKSLASQGRTPVAGLQPSTGGAGSAARRRQRLDPSLRRPLLMAAAARTFARLGFEGTRMEDIAEEAGVAKGLLYRHFPSKEALFKGLMEERGAEFTRRLQESWATVRQAGAPDPWALIDAGLTTWLDEASDPETMLSWVEPAQWGLVSTFRDQTLQAVVDEILAVAPRLDKGKAWLIASAFQGVLEAATLEWRRRGGASKQDLQGLIRAFVLRGFDGLRTYFDLPLPPPPTIPPPASTGTRARAVGSRREGRTRKVP
jgi:AcrR family transcriptional regulator